MPRGTMVERAAPPASCRCDFCGRLFKPLAWNERTCFRCDRDGCPNQSKLSWDEYQGALSAFLRSIGRLAPLSGAALNPSTAALRKGQLARTDRSVQGK